MDEKTHFKVYILFVENMWGWIIMSNYYMAEKNIDNNSKNKKNQEVKKFLNNYINQLKIHFDLNDEEMFNIIESVQHSRKNGNHINKWWHIWK